MTNLDRHHLTRRDAGVTFLEVLAVLVILGMIATIATPPVIRHLAKARIDTGRLQLQGVAASLDMFQLDMGRYPTQEEGLAVLLTRPENTPRWNGPYVKRVENLSDPWGKMFVYKIPGDHGDYDLFSDGGLASGASSSDAYPIRSW